MLVYKHAFLELEFKQMLHPEVRLVLEDLADWSETQGLPAPVVCCVHRTPKLNKLVDGAVNSLHLVDSAVDIRRWHYNKNQREAVWGWVKTRCADKGWELIEHLKGGRHFEHFHIGFKDSQWRATYGAPRP